MKVSAMISMLPLGTELSLSPYIAACERILRDADLEVSLHSQGTNVEGDYDEVFGAMKRCIEKVHEMGCARLSVLVKLGSRTDKDIDGAAMVRSVEEKLTD
jgi:uncharacterized protein (TIGR00106 family)